MASFKKIHYGLRPAKNVERKLIVEAIKALEARFNIAAYRYIGLGSIYFVDFSLVHRVLGISDMLSIEKERAHIRRAEFNAPFACIRVEPGDTTSVLPMVRLGERPTILWLDYDSELRGPVLDDIPIATRELGSGSMLLVTVNAMPSQLDVPNPEEGYTRRHELARLTDRNLEEIAVKATETKGLPPFMGEFLISRTESLVRRASGDQLRFVPLFNFRYSDGATMVTVGGMIVNDNDAVLLAECQLFERFPYVTGGEQYEISLPWLTSKEKAVLDQLLPCAQPLTGADVDRLGFELNDREAESYSRFYRFYPTFSEYVA